MFETFQEFLIKFEEADEAGKQKILFTIFNYIETLKNELQEHTTIWNETRTAFFGTKDLNEKLKIIENFIVRNKIYLSSQPTMLPPMLTNFTSYHDKKRKKTYIDEQYLQQILTNIYSMLYSKEDAEKISDIYKKQNELSVAIEFIEFKDVEDAMAYYKSEENPKFKSFKKDYDKLRIELTKLLNKIYAVYIKLEFNKQKEREAYDKILGMYDKALRTREDGVAVETGIGTAMESMFQKYNLESGILSPDTYRKRLGYKKNRDDNK